MNIFPAKLELSEGSSLLIAWSDGQQRRYAFQELRDACPCATCREKRQQPEPASGGLNILSAAEAKPLKIEDMKPVGNYAYAIHFSDGHNTGIYTIEFLRQLGQQVPEASP